MDVHVYVDSDWASCPKTRRSLTGVCVQLAGGPVAYKTKLQPTITQSSTEAEFMRASDFGKILLYLRSVLWDLGIPQHATSILYEDNTVMAMAQKPTSRTRHMDIKYQVLCEWVDHDLLTLKRIHTTVNMADLFTKHLGPTLFYQHTDYVLGHDVPTTSDCSSSSTLTLQASLNDTTNVCLKLSSIWTHILHNPYNFCGRPSP